MMFLISLVLAAIVSIEGRTILSNTDYLDPSALKVNGTYYVIAGTMDDAATGIFPIHQSTDLMDWTPAGYVFDLSETPSWAKNSTFYYPLMHQVGSNFLVYFSAYTTNNTASSYLEVGVAIAAHPLGPYTATDRPVLTISGRQLFYPKVINDEDKLYLVWSTGLTNIVARQLDSLGLSISSKETISVLEPSLAWEGGYVYAPWHIQRQNYHYLFYTAHGACGLVGIARSSNALGPYEKLSTPIITSNNTCTGETSIVKDLHDQNDLIIFNANTSVVLANLTWDSDDWPSVGEF